MRAKVTAVFLGIQENSFIDKKTGEKIEFKRATFNVRNSSETFELGIPKDLDTTFLNQYQDAYLLLDLRYNQASRNYTGRVVNVYPDEDTMNFAPMLSQSESQEL